MFSTLLMTGALVVTWLGIAGCAALARPIRYGVTGAASLPPPALNYRDYVGVTHVHTRASHDAHGTFEDMVRTANAHRLDFCLVTEHNTLSPLREGRQGWHGATLVLVGVELSTRGGHYLAFNVTQEIDREHLTTQQVIDEVTRQGGLGFIAHPYFKKRRWVDWAVTGMTGLEAYNVAHDTLDENLTRLAFWTMTASPTSLYLSIIDRPYDPLQAWDQLITRHGRMVGIGSTDAHEFHLFGLKFAPYDVMFQLVRTHVLVPTETPQDDGSSAATRGPGHERLSAQQVYEALRAGHTYFAIELIEEAKGFLFIAQRRNDLAGLMGDEVMWAPDLVLSAWVPAESDLVLVKDGTPIARAREIAWTVPVQEPGAYRLEVTRQGKPWIFSNPIYVRAATEPGP